MCFWSGQNNALYKMVAIGKIYAWKSLAAFRSYFNTGRAFKWFHARFIRNRRCRSSGFRIGTLSKVSGRPPIRNPYPADEPITPLLAHHTKRLIAHLITIANRGNEITVRTPALF